MTKDIIVKSYISSLLKPLRPRAESEIESIRDIALII